MNRFEMEITARHREIERDRNLGRKQQLASQDGAAPPTKSLWAAIKKLGVSAELRTRMTDRPVTAS